MNNFYMQSLICLTALLMRTNIFLALNENNYFEVTLLYQETSKTAQHLFKFHAILMIRLCMLISNILQSYQESIMNDKKVFLFLEKCPAGIFRTVYMEYLYCNRLTQQKLRMEIHKQMDVPSGSHVLRIIMCHCITDAFLLQHLQLNNSHFKEMLAL